MSTNPQKLLGFLTILQRDKINNDPYIQWCYYDDVDLPEA